MLSIINVIKVFAIKVMLLTLSWAAPLAVSKMQGRGFLVSKEVGQLQFQILVITSYLRDDSLYDFG